MGLMTPNFHDLTINTQNLTCHIPFSVLNGRFRRAQIWVDDQLMEKMSPFVPRRTGRLLNTLKSINAGKRGTGEVQTVWSYGKKLYTGVNPKTGMPWHWTNPNTQPYWGAYTLGVYRDELKRGAAYIVKTGRYP